MTRIVLVAQDKGGVGKSLVTRGLAEVVPDAPVVEVDSTRRLIELRDRTQFFGMRAERADIERTGGRAARSEFDPVIDAIASATLPTIVDVGANTARSLLATLIDLQEDLHAGGIELAVLIVTTAEPGALTETPRLLKLSGDLKATTFLIENRLHGPVDAASMKSFGKSATVSVLEEHTMEEEAGAILQDGGLAIIPNLAPTVLTKEHGLGLGSRIRRDLERLRADVMAAVRPAAEWLVNDGT